MRSLRLDSSGLPPAGSPATLVHLSLNVRTLAMRSRSPQELYTGTNGSGLYHSTNGGETWTPMPLIAAAQQAR